MAQSILEYILRSKKEGTGAKEVKDELKGVEDQAKKTGGMASFLGDNFAITAGDMVSFAKQIPAMVIDLTEQGVAINNAEKALIGYTGSSDEAERAIRAVTNAAGGAITKFEATQNASRLFAMGLADTTDEAAQLTEMAITLGAAMGEDASTSFENFSLMLANQSIPRLDTFGISGAAVRERMNELTESVAGMDRQTAFLTATLELGADAMADLDAAGFQAVSSLDRLKATLGNAKDGLAETVADGLMPMIDQGYRLKDTIDQTRDSLIDQTDSFDEYQKRVDQLKKDHPILMAGWEGVTEAEYENEKQTRLLSEITDQLTRSNDNTSEAYQRAQSSADNYRNSLNDTTGSTDDLTSSTDGLVISIGKVTQAKLAQEAIEALTVAYDAGTISEQGYINAAEYVLTNLAGLTPAEAEASIALDKLKRDFDNGTTEASEYYNQVLSLGNSIRGLPSSKTITIKVDTKYQTYGKAPGKVGGEQPGLQLGGDWIVSGPAGIDAVPVSFMATAGERVTVTPQGMPGPSGSGSGLTIDARGAQFFGIGGISEFANQLLPHLEDARRNV